jgi:predicted transcriptional regulator
MAAAAIRPVAIKIDDDTKARLKRLADARHRTAHWLMREAITQYVEREERREAFRQDTFKAWDEYRSTGLHVTADEADTWLADLELGKDTEPPGCRVCSGAVTLIQRFGSAANLNIHRHCPVLDGVYRRSADGSPEFVEAPAPSDEALQSVLHRTITRLMKLLTRRGMLFEEEQGSTYITDNDGDSDDARVLRPQPALTASPSARVPARGC